MGFSIPFFKKKSEKSVYFGLYITDSSAFGFVFEVTKGQTYIISQNTYNLTAGFDKILEDIDNLISELELKTNHHLSQTIFFLHSWMIDAETFEIKAPYKGIIKKLSKDLELEPLGYIDVKEALERYFIEKSIVNTVAIEVNKTKLGVCVIKGNKIVHSQYIARTDEVGDDLNSVFKELPKHVVLPNSMKIFGDEDKAEISSKLATYEWDEAIFPQHPTIEIIKQDELNQTLVETFTKEMILNADPKDFTGVSATQVTSPSSGANDSAHFGFLEGKDVLTDAKPPIIRPAQDASSSQQIVINSQDNTFDIQPEKNDILNMKDSFSSGDTGESQGVNKKKITIITAITVVVIVGILAFYEYFLHTLHIKIYLKSKTVDQTFDIDIPIKDTESNELAVIKKDITNEYSNKKNTSGVRDVGENATGIITIHNFDNSERTFVKGTEISKGSFTFLLDSEVKVAPSSEVTTNGVKQSGKKSVNVTAKDIGAEYNLASGTQFKIASLPESLYLAIADDAFTGGSKKEVSTVSKKDIDALEAEAEKQAKQNSENVLGTQISNDEIIISDLTSAKVIDTTFSGEIGEEATSLTIKAASEVEYFTIKKNVLLASLKELFDTELDSGYTVDSDNIDYTIEDVTQGNNEVQLSIDVSATTHKEVQLEEIKSLSRMHLVGSLEDVLVKDFDIEKIEIDQRFGWIPVLSSWVPFFSKNISISTSVR